MPIAMPQLAALAADYAHGMTSIRGRRVQRLLKREFAQAEQVLILRSAAGATAVLGLAPAGAIYSATTGRGRHADVVTWRHGEAEAVATQYDLLKDSLPALGTRVVPLAGLAGPHQLPAEADALPPQARELLAQALDALA